MKHIGPWIFVAGLVTLCAGIASTRSASWKAPAPDQPAVALDMRGVDTLDVGPDKFAVVTISDLPPAINIDWYGTPANGREAIPITAVRTGNRMRLERTSRAPLLASLKVPPTLASLSGAHLNVIADAAVGALGIEAFDLDWKGDAQSLDIKANEWPGQSRADCSSEPEVVFDSGKVARLRISIERGKVDLRDLSQVDQVEVHASPGVRFAVGRIADLPRIKLLPFDGVATEAPACN